GQEGVVVTNDDEEVAFEAAGERHAVTKSVAETVSVLADPSPPPRTALPEQLVLGKDRYGRCRACGGGVPGDAAVYRLCDPEHARKVAGGTIQENPLWLMSV